MAKRKQTRWERFRPERADLEITAIGLECDADRLLRLAARGDLPGHIVQNLGDTANRLKAEAKYLRSARRELR